MEQLQLQELEEAVQHLSDGLNAMNIMVMGLEQIQDAHTGGFYAVWRYLDEADREVHRCLDICMTAT